MKSRKLPSKDLDLRSLIWRGLLGFVALWLVIVAFAIGGGGLLE